MTKALLNTDGTVNLDSAERALAAAEKACDEAFREVRRKEVEAARIPTFRIEHGRALKALEIARSNADGAFEVVQRARGAVCEALNPEVA